MFDLDFFDSIPLAGCDEVGRGPIAGPVVAASTYYFGGKSELERVGAYLENLGVTDSKKLTTKKRRAFLSEIQVDVESLKPDQVYSFFGAELKSLKFSICEKSHEYIDRHNILFASLEAMKTAHQNCHNSKEPCVVLFDGNKLPKELNPEISAHSIVKGDSKSILIGLASIIAKEYRDLLMENYSKLYPAYQFERHAGYPTKAHLEALEKHGICPIHRKSFGPVKRLL